MKDIIIFLLWIITTMILAISLVGIFTLVLMADESDWFKVPMKCIDKK